MRDRRHLGARAVRWRSRLGARVGGRELERPLGAEAPAREHERPVLAVGVEQHEERVVLDRPRRAGPGVAISRPLRNMPSTGSPLLPVASGHLQPVGAKPPHVGQAGAFQLLAAQEGLAAEDGVLVAQARSAGA